MASRRHLLAAGAAALPLTVLRPARAQAPLRQAVIINAFPPGGATDMAARMVAEGLHGSYAATTLVDNRTGGGGRVGTEYAKRLPADGSALLYTPAFPMVLFPHVYRTLLYDTLKDFTPVALTTRSMLALSVGPAVPNSVRTLADFVAWCRADPAKATYGAPSGASQHFAGVMLGRAAGVELTLVPYRGGAPTVTDMLGGHIAAAINPLAEVLPHASGGGARILVVFGSRRSRFLPDVPTAQEFGYRDVVFQDWSGVFMPAGAPPELVRRANTLINGVMSSPQGVEAAAKFGAEIEPGTPEDFAAAVRFDYERYGAIVRSTGFVAED
ncbi:tripartite tricarboxylate transporter substrate-binding protein [Roseomonas sp. BN140053]|uniref:tripartite tricarboxylate transporter substrate-binding protein n=1 Tax=Roseomonas sp. BN140053 TaxID=3391898 RepID=UPI0039ED7803